ncbi:MAG: methyltransferase domain-containing protein [Ginsengibacter sp.]
MTEESFKSIAEQLRKPHGTIGKDVGIKMNEGNLLMNKDTISELGAQANDNILEIGMGNGFFVKYILSVDETIKYTGCDFSEVMVDEAAIYNEQYIKNKQAQFHVADACNLPFNNEHFDKIFTINTVYFWDDVEKVLSEIKRVLKKKGLFIISIRPESIMNNFPFTKFGFNKFSGTGLAELLAENGLIVNSIIEKEEADIDLFGEKTKNGFLIVKAKKPE